MKRNNINFPFFLWIVGVTFFLALGSKVLGGEPENLLKQGMDYDLVQHDYDKAISVLNKAIELKSDYGEAYGLRGGVYLHEEKYDQAISDFSKAIELGNTDNIYYLRGEAYRFKGDYEKAHADYQKTLELDPKDSRIKSRLEMVGNRKNNEMAVKVSNGINHSFMYLIGISLQSNLMMFLLRSMLGIPFLTLLFWRTFPTWKNIASVILIIFDALIAITFIRLVATWNAMSSLPASIELTILFLLTIFWPLALGISWRWKPKTQKNHILRILCFIAVGFFVGINAWLPVSRIIREFNSPHEVMAQVDSPQGGMTATAFFVHGPTMFNDGETFVNLRRKGSPFQPIAVFRKDFLTDNPDNVMHLTGYDARYVGTDFIWADETHLKILVAGYEQLSKNTKDDYMNHYAIIFDKKLDHWGNVEITYGNQ